MLIDFYTAIKNQFTKVYIFNEPFFIVETSLIGKALNFGFNEYGFESCVSNILYNYNVSYVLNSININKARKNLIFKINFSKRNLIFLRLLKNLNFIHKFLVIKKNNKLCIYIYLYYFKNAWIGKNFKLISTPSKSFFISFKALRLLTKRTGNSIFIISTNLGLVTHNTAVKEKIGGLLIGFYSF